MKRIFLFGIFLILLFGVYIIFRPHKNEIFNQKTQTILLSKTPTPKKTSIQISPLTLEKIFFGDKSYLKQLDQNKLISIISTGDIIPARMVNVQAINNNDFTWSFKNVWEILKDADLTVASLEAPLFENCEPTKEGMVFCGSNKHVNGLLLSGIDLVTLANNHTGNYGQKGIDETVKLLTANNIKHAEIGKITYLTIKNIKFAFLGWNFLDEPDEKTITEQVSEAKNNSDIVIVFPHWGEEYQEKPSTFEINMNKILLNSGADLIFGNHPHIIQPIEIGANTLTFFAHGNFIFDQEWSENTKKGFVSKTWIYDQKIIDVEIIPIYIKDYGQPEIIEGEEKNKAINELYKLSVRYLSKN
jgi:poly-gamma-glutamate capsule biosynthesis protein CapA/YwtB (metallophosphatase superfamily)